MKGLRQRIARIVRARRTELELTQAQVAEGVGLSRVTITNIEAGRHLPTVPCLWWLCETLELSPNEILGWEE